MPLCVAGTDGVSCSEGCVLTSAGLTCGSTDVLNTLTVSGAPPVSTPPPPRVPGPNPKPKPAPKPEPSPIPTVVPVPDTERRIVATTARELPFTGAMVLPVFLVGWVVLAGGLLLRRRTRSGTSVAAPVSTTQVRTGAPTEAATGMGPRFGGAMVIPATIAGWALLACSLLLRRRRGGRR